MYNIHRNGKKYTGVRGIGHYWHFIVIVERRVCEGSSLDWPSVCIFRRQKTDLSL